MRKLNSWLIVSSILLVIFMVGCSEKGTEQPSDQGQEPPVTGQQPPENKPDDVEVPIKTDPVTLTVLDGNGLNEEDFALLVADPLKKKYPHITVEKITGSTAQLVASGQTPDLLFNHNGNFGLYSDLELLMDLSDLMKKHQVDLGKFNPAIAKAVAYEGEGQVNGIPYSVQIGATYYNMDLFDQFGVDYPEDGMTWQDAIEVGRKMSRFRTEDGVAIRGLDTYDLMRFQRLLGSSVYDPASNKATLNTPEWRKIFELQKQILDIPYNVWTDGELQKGQSPVTNFLDTRISAMYVVFNLLPRLKEPTEAGLRWDVAQHPSFPERPNVYSDVDAHLGIVTSVSKHKDEAFLVLASMVSDEVQSAMVRSTGRVSPLKDSKYKELFAADLPHAQGKNLASIFKSDMAESPLRPLHFGEANKILRAAFYDYYANNKDVNSALREADEKLNQYLESRQ